MILHNSEITIASDFEHEKVYAEIKVGGEDFAVITQEKDVRILVFPHSSHKPWDFNFDEIIEILTKAKKHLTQEDLKKES